jgi:hypothetical protein
VVVHYYSSLSNSRVVGGCYGYSPIFPLTQTQQFTALWLIGVSVCHLCCFVCLVVSNLCLTACLLEGWLTVCLVTDGDRLIHCSLWFRFVSSSIEMIAANSGKYKNKLQLIHRSDQRNLAESQKRHSAAIIVRVCLFCFMRTSSTWSVGYRCQYHQPCCGRSSCGKNPSGKISTTTPPSACRFSAGKRSATAPSPLVEMTVQTPSIGD